MENKQNQPASGANATGTSKTANASSQPSANAASQRAASSSNTVNAAAISTPETEKTSTTAENAPSRTSASLGQEQTHGESLGYRGKEENLKDQWAAVSSWLGNTEIPQSVKDLGTKALDQVNKLSTTQKVVGGALLLGGIGWLSLRGNKQNSRSSYRDNSDSSDDSFGKSYGSSARGYSASRDYSSGSYGSGSRAGHSETSYRSPSAATDSWSSSADKDSSTSYRSGSASTSSSLGEEDYSGRL